MSKVKLYSELFREANEKGALEEITTSFKTFVGEGDMLIGKFLYSEQVEPKENMGPVNRYVFETDDGLQSCLLGAAADKQVEGKFKTGEVYVIIFRGKIPIDNGSKSVNKWEISHVPTVRG
jgi:hypothetical protein